MPPWPCSKPNAIYSADCDGIPHEASSGSRRWVSPALGQGKGLNRRPFPWTPSRLNTILRKELSIPLPSGSSFAEKMLVRMLTHGGSSQRPNRSAG
jgi:hypothetical protein